MDPESESHEDKSVTASQQGKKVKSSKSVGEDKSSPTASGPDSDHGSVDDLPIDDDQAESTKNVASKVTSGASYIGSFFSSAYKTTMEASSAGSNGLFSSAMNLVGGGSSNKTSPTGEEIMEKEIPTTEETNLEESGKIKESETIPSSSSSFFSSAWTKMGDLTKNINVTGSVKQEDEPKAETPTSDLTNKSEEVKEKQKASGSFFSSFSNMVTKVASDATHVIKDKVGTSIPSTMINEFNKEQEEFIKSKGESDHISVAPWTGYQDEAVVKEKILSLSEDKRTFIRAPPAGVSFEFDYNTVAPVALVILSEDPKLVEMRYKLVPKEVKEDEFWRNYFYRLNLIKQTFDLKDLESSNESSKKPKTDLKPLIPDAKIIQDEDDQPNQSTDHDDEFISDAFQASSKDLDEVNENMKRLGVKKTDEEWEAELEGELNEFEVVSSKEGSPQNQDWENEIENMLDEEDAAAAK